MTGAKRSKKRTKVTKAAFRRAISQQAGNVSAIARQFNVERQTIYNYLNRWELWDELNTKKANIVGASEQTIYDAVLDGDTDAARFVLTHHPRNKERWSSKHEVSVSGVNLSPETLGMMEELGVDVETAAEAFEAQIRRLHAERIAAAHGG